MTHTVRLIDITSEIRNAYTRVVGELCRAMEAEGPVTSKGVLRAYGIGVDIHMTLCFVDSDHYPTWEKRAQAAVDFLEDIADECKGIAYRTASWNGKLTEQGARLLDLHEALEALEQAIENAISKEGER